jgi:hypothetical protein
MVLLSAIVNSAKRVPMIKFRKGGPAGAAGQVAAAMTGTQTTTPTVSTSHFYIAALL